MTFTARNKPHTTNNLKRFDGFNGSWDQYKEYLSDNGVLSSNFLRERGTLVLRGDYHPPWSLKDFK